MTESSMRPEQIYLENDFGTVTNKRVIFYEKKGWFGGGSRQDIPLKHVTSVRLEFSRDVGWGISLSLVGLLMISAGIGIPILIAGLLLLYGSPLIIVSTSGNNRSELKGYPWDRQKAELFINELRNQLVNN